MTLPINQVLCGDAAELMRGLPDASIHAIVTDPPYGLEFMGEEWDKFREEDKSKYFHRPDTETAKGFGAKDFGTPIKVLPRSPEGPALLVYQQWTTVWAREALRVLLPGASMLVMGGTRTYHRMACGVEDAGFEVKDTILWCYNSGFPKAQDLGKMIEKRERGDLIRQKIKYFREQRGLTTKELAEKINLPDAKKSIWDWENDSHSPSEKSWNIIKSILKVTVGEENQFEREIIGKKNYTSSVSMPLPVVYNGKRIRLDITAPATHLAREWGGWKVGGLKPSYEPVVWAVKPPEGSTTDNVLKHGVGAINVDACRIPYESEDDRESTRFGVQTDIKGGGYGSKRPSNGHILAYDVVSSPQGRYPANMVRTDRFEDGYDRFYFVPKAERAERWFKCQICNIYQDGTHLGNHSAHALHCHDCNIDFPNTEEEREAHKNHRTESNIVTHPTVKPVALGEFLIKLVTREGQIVLDQFCGLGSFLVAARNSNRQYIGFDNGSEYYEIARRRLAAIPPPLEAFA